MQQKRCVRSPLGAAESYLIFERPKKKSPSQKKIPRPKGGGIYPLLPAPGKNMPFLEKNYPDSAGQCPRAGGPPPSPRRLASPQCDRIIVKYVNKKSK